MINGAGGKRIAMTLSAGLIGLVLLRVVLLMLRQNGAAMSLDNIIALLTGGVMGAFGVSPYPAPAAPLVMVRPELPAPTVVVQSPAEPRQPWVFDPVTGERL